MTTFSLQAQIAEVEREIKKRQEVYGRMVASGKMKQSQADWLIACMGAVRQSLLDMSRADLALLIDRTTEEGPR